MSESCQSCDFCMVTNDGELLCAMRDKQVHGDQSCRWWQHETRVLDGDEKHREIDGDNFYEVMTWPERRKSPRS